MNRKSFLTSVFCLLTLAPAALPQGMAKEAPPPDRTTPRRTVQSFFQWVKGDDQNLALAGRCLDPRGIPADENAGELAVKLQRLLDSVGIIPDEALPDDPNFEDEDSGEALLRPYGGETHRWIYLVRSGDHWLFSPETTRSIPSYYDKLFPGVVHFVLENLPEETQYKIPILGVRLWQVLGLGILLLISFTIGQIFRWLVNVPIRRLVHFTKTDWDDVLLSAVAKPFGYLVMVGFLALTFHMLQFYSINAYAISGLSVIATLILVWAAYRTAEGITAKVKEIAAVTDSKVDDHLIPLVRIALRTIVIALGGVLVLQSLGVNVGALVAGLGIGGLAIALAAQSVLGDLFASVTIALDKPFVVGDYIVVGEFMGTVEYVGLKTTRIRSLTGEQLVCSNAGLLSTTIRNYKHMEERRIAFAFGVTYQTSHAQLKAIPQMVRDLFTEIKRVRFDRVHFINFGDSSLDFEVVYYVLSRDYAVYRDIQEEINLALFHRFEEEKIEFAYPSQTLFIESFPGKDQALT